MAANREAVAIVLDAGPHMLGDFDEAKRCVEMIIQRKIFSESKDEIALVVFGSENTNNTLSSDTEYQNIDVISNLKVANFDVLSKLQDVESSDMAADFIDAIVVALDLLEDQTKNQKFGAKRVVLLSNLAGECSESQLKVIAKGMKNAGMELTVLCPFHIDTENSSEKLTKSQQKAAGILSEMLEVVGGDAYPFSQALHALMSYEKKKVRPTPWNASLEIGRELSIPISAYLKITELKPKPWKQCVSNRREALVRGDTTLHLNDAAETEVEKDDTNPGYRYGTTLVPFTVEDRDIMEYAKGGRGYQVVGFTASENVKRYFYMGDKTSYVVGRSGDESAEAALAAFVHALEEKNMVAIVRYAYSDRSVPRMGFLRPLLKENYECLVFIQLPFMEDMRRFVFAPLDVDKNNIPTGQQLSAMDDLIATMDLSTAIVDEDGEAQEALKPSQTSNPYLQRLYQCLHHRALHPDAPLPKVLPHIEAALKPPKTIQEAMLPALKKLQSAFPLERLSVDKFKEAGDAVFDARSNGNEADVSEPATKKHKGDTSMAGLMATEVIKIDTIDPVGNFKQLVSQKDSNFENVCKQLQEVILKLLGDPLGGMYHTKALNCVKAYREVSVEENNPAPFNTFLGEVKEKYSTKEKTIWDMFASAPIDLIAKKECSSSTVSDEDVANFYKSEQVEDDTKQEEPAKDEEDLLDMM
ncbi:X-ray repair cross-complementing protein 5-like isoform X2 [Ornithodoros turicata]|uniref:X-ray repair cross-complementing protein 5-like isoform X2 n=1 Tax=Ornithodoros turicata TaxID=34597 RepID=UPI003138F6BA